MELAIPHLIYYRLNDQPAGNLYQNHLVQLNWLEKIHTG